MSLDPKFQFGALDLAAPPFAIAYGSDFGSPEQVVASVQSALRDGSLTKVTKYDNRTVEIPVLIEGATQLELADAEALLVAEALKKRNEFTFNPGDGTAPDSVFDTFTANLVPDRDDDREIGLMRLYTLTFDAHPWPHSVEKVITPALTTPPSTETLVTIDAATSAAAWSIVSGGPAQTAWTSSGGAVFSSVPYDPATYTPSFYAVVRRSGSVNMAATPYLRVDWSSNSPAGGPAYAARLFASQPGGASSFERVAEQSLGPGLYRTWFLTGGATYTGFDIGFNATRPREDTQIVIYDLSRTDTPPASGTRRQLSRIIDPGGSVPAEGTIIVEHATVGLGQTIVYSHPLGGGYTPPLRRWLVTSDAVTGDAASVSGATNLITGITDYRVPISAMPEGGVGYWARLYNGSTGTVRIHWAAVSYLGSTPVGDGQGGSTLVTWNTAGWQVVQLARLSLPTARVGPSGFVRVSLQRDAGSSAGILIDEAWLFAMDEGCLTVVDCGTGTPAAGTVANRLKITASSLDDPYGSILTGSAADWSDTYAPPTARILCDQTSHRFDPDGSNIFTVTTGTLDASVSLEHYRRWHTHAAD